MSSPHEKDAILEELRRMNRLLTLIFVDGKEPHEKIGFLSDLGMSSTEIAKYVEMHPGNIRKVVQKWKKIRGK